MSNQLIVRPESQVGYVPQGLDDLLRVGTLLVKSGLAPESVKTAEQAAIVMLKGMELGLKPLESFADVYVVRGQASLGTKLMMTLFRRAGHDFEIDEWTKDVVRGKFLLSNGRTYGHTLTRAECDEAHWSHDYDKERRVWVEKHTWKGMGKTMLMYRWQSTGIRAYCPEVLHGMVTTDEAEDAIPQAAIERDADMVEATGVTVIETAPETVQLEPEAAAPNVADAEYSEAEPEPESEPEPAVTLTGNEQRPYSPEILKAVIWQKIKDNTAKLGDKDAIPERQRTAVGAINKLMEQAFGKLEKGALDAARHDAMHYLIGKPHCNGWTDIECRVLLGWSQDPIVEDGNRVYAPHPDAIREIKALVEWQAGVEQEMLPL